MTEVTGSRASSHRLTRQSSAASVDVDTYRQCPITSRKLLYSRGKFTLALCGGALVPGVAPVDAQLHEEWPEPTAGSHTFSAKIAFSASEPLFPLSFFDDGSRAESRRHEPMNQQCNRSRRSCVLPANSANVSERHLH